MAFLTLNGVEIPVLDGNASRSRVLIGERGRAFDGTFRSSVRARKRQWSLATPVVTKAEADAIVGLVEGQGHHWSFDADLYSDKGLVGTGAGASVGTTSPSPKFGAGRLGITTGNTATFALSLGGAWTVMVWQWDGAAWDHYVVTSAGHKWVNGIRNDAATTTWLAVSSGTLTLSAPSAAAYYDDLVALPYVIPAAWAEVWGVATSAFSALPRLAMAGDIGTATVEGELGAEAYTQAQVDGGWRDNALTVEFTLSEV